jgi:hypothetical protein
MGDILERERLLSRRCSIKTERERLILKKVLSLFLLGLVLVFSLPIQSKADGPIGAGVYSWTGTTNYDGYDVFGFCTIGWWSFGNNHLHDVLGIHVDYDRQNGVYMQSFELDIAEDDHYESDEYNYHLGNLVYWENIVCDNINEEMYPYVKYHYYIKQWIKNSSGETLFYLRTELMPEYYATIYP